MKLPLPALLVSLALSACAADAPKTVATSPAAAAATTPAVAQAPAPAAAAAPAVAPAAAQTADLAAGQRAFEQGCFACHDQATVLSQGGRTKADWEDVVAMMQDRGYSGSPNDVRLIVEYLAATYPPKT